MSNYNLTEVIEMAGGDDDFVKVIIETFLEEIPPDVKSMAEAIDNSNPTLAYQFAHKMKPNLQLFGLELMEQILTIEAWAKGTGAEGKAREAKEKISTKVTLAEKELKEDFGL
ncbi:Hpt domain-containing protein [Gillisia sp. M10.2A]|uniref:Hpt domain-containing protein n=1 Tax=Gillisia lutea TaxID=2909668 RepID=A0ABS9EHU5_9FLAO|nr:Hpt domain-containing protein [Gillisia lutea]MCF4101011.1 Hpt domain-containing protein [Gillisia lutea]